MADRDSVREPTTSIVFPAEFDPAEDGTRLKLASVGVRKRWMFSVYAFGLYYNEEGAKRELARWNTYELDELRVNVSFYNNLTSSHFCKAVRLVLARNARGSDLRVAFEETLRPRIQRLANTFTHGHAKVSKEEVIGQALDALCDFRSQFEGLRLTKGTEICLRNEADTLITSINGDELQRITNQLLCSALFDVFIGYRPISPEAKEYFGIQVGVLVVNHNHLSKPSIATRLRSRL